MNRSEFQTLAEIRIKEAKALLDAQLWDGAYYLAGYAVECALKACILARVERTGIIFEEKKFAEKCWTHNLADLVDLAELDTARDAEAKAKPRFTTHWPAAVEWSETTRYKRMDQAAAENLYAAITDPTDGALQWIRRHW